MGTGANFFNYLENNISNSFMLGFNSDVPSFFVGPSPSAGTWGRVGIGSTAPEGQLHVTMNRPGIPMVVETQASSHVEIRLQSPNTFNDLGHSYYLGGQERAAHFFDGQNDRFKYSIGSRNMLVLGQDFADTTKPFLGIGNNLSPDTNVRFAIANGHLQIIGDGAPSVVPKTGVNVFFNNTTQRSKYDPGQDHMTIAIEGT